MYTKKKDSNKWNLRYVGQRKSSYIKQRLKEHLVKKHEKTGSKLSKIDDELFQGNEVGIKLMRIEPEELRLYYESKLLANTELDWNIHK